MQDCVKSMAKCNELQGLCSMDVDSHHLSHTRGPLGPHASMADSDDDMDDVAESRLMLPPQDPCLSYQSDLLSYKTPKTSQPLFRHMKLVNMTATDSTRSFSLNKATDSPSNLDNHHEGSRNTNDVLKRPQQEALISKPGYRSSAISYDKKGVYCDESTAHVWPAKKESSLTTKQSKPGKNLLIRLGSKSSSKHQERSALKQTHLTADDSRTLTLDNHLHLGQQRYVARKTVPNSHAFSGFTRASTRKEAGNVASDKSRPLISGGYTSANWAGTRCEEPRKDTPAKKALCRTRFGSDAGWAYTAIMNAWSGSVALLLQGTNVLSTSLHSNVAITEILLAPHREGREGGVGGAQS